jgi:hypothetical protein
MDILLFTAPVQSRLELEFIALTGGVSFDIAAAADQLVWAAGEGGIPALELDSSGTTENDLAIFTPYFAAGSQASELAALASLDGHGDGLIDISDDAFASLKIWQDLDHDGTSDTSELKSLQDYGIDEIDSNATPVDDSVDGQQLAAEGTFDKADSTGGTFVEVALDAALGGASSQTPIGDNSEDTLASGLASDTLPGGLGNETLSSAKIDMAEPQDGNFSSGDLISDLQQVVESAAGTTQQVDAVAPSSGANFVDVVVLARYGASNADLVNAVFGGQEHQLILP